MRDIAPCQRYGLKVVTKEILLFNLRTIREAKVDIIHHMDQSLQGVVTMLRFLDET